MAQIPLAKPVEIGIDTTRLQRVFDLTRNWIETDRVPAIGLAIGRKGKILDPLLIGRQKPIKESPPLRKDSLFLVASITKPVTVAAAMMLVERGHLALTDRVKSFVPRFTGDGRDDVQVIHLMTHTSGLPDMVADNDKLREQHKPFAAFIDAIIAEPLLFPAGTQVNYQSMGTALLAEIIQQITGKTLAEFLRKEVFDPLAMTHTSLGWDQTRKERVAGIRVPPAMEDKDWNWNSPYWLGFGAPWGGLITSLTDFGRYCQMMLNGGILDGVRILSPSTVRALTTNQLANMPKIPEENRRCKPWGLGWRMNWPGQPSTFGDLLGPRSYGHAGATGTVCWIDPDLDAYCLIFTTQPQDADSRFLARLSNAVVATMV